jgi:hypothetical protein
MRYLLALSFFLLVALSTQAQQKSSKPINLNLSRDLVKLGIASKNLAPNDPSLDARPLFQAALQYVKNAQMQRLTVDSGAYYFLTPENSTTYLNLGAITNLTVDLAGSTIYFANSFLRGFSLSDCRHVLLTNFQIDFLNPPYTYVRLASVDPSQRTLTYTTLPGWPDPATLTTPSNISTVIWAAVFRNNRIVAGTSRMQVSQSIADNVLSLVQDDTPWTQASTLLSLQPGDTIVVTQRGGSPPVIATGGDSIGISNATIFGSGAIALLLNSVSDSIVERVQVMPRKGNLISSNADGIHFVSVGSNNHIRNCYVTGTLDDAFAMDSRDVASVPAVTQAGATQLQVSRTEFMHFPDGTSVNFVDPNSANEINGAAIVSQDPADTSPPIRNGTVTLKFDRPLPALASGAGMVFASQNLRGAGSSIENNFVGEIPFGRGIWIGGAQGIAVQGNNIGPTSNGGIVVFEDTKSYPVPPAGNIDIQFNIVYGSLGPMASGSGTQIALGGIMVDSINFTGRFATSSPNTNISIRDNWIYGSGRCGIWVGQLDTGTIRDNAVIHYGQYPNLPLFGVSNEVGLQLRQDFTQPVAVHNSENVLVFNNAISR